MKLSRDTKKIKEIEDNNILSREIENLQKNAKKTVFFAKIACLLNFTF